MSGRIKEKGQALSYVGGILMEDNIVVMNLSSAYEKENFYKSIDSQIIDCKEILGTNCYCDENGQAELKNKIKDFGPGGIHFIDSGNYHYISKFWTDKIKKKFNLILFDHHTDMKESMFMNLLSCGSWVKEVLDSNKYIKKVFLIGPAEKYINQIEKKYKDRVIAIDEDNIKNKSITHLAASFDINEPVYISIDKDILGKNVIRTNWDQGHFTLKELKVILKNIMNKEKVIGVDICGESSEDFNIAAGYANNDKINEELMNFTLKECAE